MAEAIAGRPAWLAANTHPGEDAVVLGAHARLAAATPNLLTVVAPRHPDRGTAIAELAAARGGLDASAADQIAALPAPDPRRPADRLGRWLWTSIVVLGVVAGALALLRFG